MAVRRSLLVLIAAVLVLAAVVVASREAESPVRPVVAADVSADLAVRSAVTKPPSPGAQQREPVVIRRAWARAAGVTVWLRPGKVREIDRPALRRTPHITRWINRQTLAQREGLTDRVLTQAVQGEPVDVLRERAGWSRVRLPRQRGDYFSDGIIGWVPSRQLAATAPRPAATHGAAARQHHHPRLQRMDGGAALAEARRYLGVPYLWGGMTKQGVDCSGLTYRVFQRLGRTLPRDAADQSRVGRAVRRAQLSPGDLVFFGPHGRRSIHHVGIWAGDGLVLHAPHTGDWVRLTPLHAWSDFWGARRLR